MEPDAGEIGVGSALRQAAARLRRALDEGELVVALTGAGVSAESGVPTFRGGGGSC